jgi:hypothetical protein
MDGMKLDFREGVTGVVMVRDDANRLKRCLESLGPMVDEIIVLDTGSTDDSVKVAKASGARVMEIEWPNAFDEALNVLLDAVETRWTLRLDSDEWLEPDQAPALKQLIERDDIFLVRAIIRSEQPNGGTADSLVDRLWRTHPEMRYQGAIHEQFWPETLERCAGSRSIWAGGLVIQHDGYSVGDQAEKKRRNLALVRRELELRPGNLYYESILADMLFELDDPGAREAMDAVMDRCVRSGRPPEQVVAGVVFAKALSTIPPESCRLPRVAKQLAYVVQHFNDFPSLRLAAAILEFKRENFRQALEHAVAVERMRTTGQFSRALSASPQNFFSAWIVGRDAAATLGDRAAESHFAALIQQAEQQVAR